MPKKIFFSEDFFRGPERIRTAVEAFAELCLATRPQDLFYSTCPPTLWAHTGLFATKLLQSLELIGEVQM